MGTNLQDDITLRVWDGDDSAKADLLVAWGGRVEKAIAKSYPTLSGDDPEDVVAEAIQRFWEWRKKYDPEKASIMTMLYRFADQVAVERVTGRLNWQRQQIREKGLDADCYTRVNDTPMEDPPDDAGVKRSPVQTALAGCYDKLVPLQQDILRAYGEARSRDFPLDAASLGVEMGTKHKNGVPIPGGTIRVNKLRGWENLDACMKKNGFDLRAMGYFDEE